MNMCQKIISKRLKCEVLYLIIRLDEYFLLSKTMADESKVK